VGDYLEMDFATFRSSMQTTLNALGAMGQTASAAVTQAMVEFCEYLLSLMQEGAPKKTGYLVEHSYVSTPKVVGDYTVVEIVWDAAYARAQDTGAYITPKNFRAVFSGGRYRSPKSGRFIRAGQVGGARLFIPRRPGVYPIKDRALRKAAGFKLGIDFVLEQYVKLDGNLFITRVLRSEAKNADRTVARLALRLWQALAGEKVPESRGMFGGSVNPEGNYQGHRGQIIKSNE